MYTTLCSYDSNALLILFRELKIAGDGDNASGHAARRLPAVVLPVSGASRPTCHRPSDTRTAHTCPATPGIPPFPHSSTPLPGSAPHISNHTCHHMSTTIRFTKMQGIGNDYIYVDTARYPIGNPAQTAIAWSRPHTGIGADGLVLIGPSDKADFSMRIFNADGSEARMCGNASRCVGKYVYEKGLTRKTDLTLETLSGIKRLHLHTRAACGQEVVEQVTVDMGVPRLLHENLTLEANGKQFTGTAVDMGNPHFVVFADDLASIDLAKDGRALGHHPAFPDRSNIEFVHVANRHEAEMHVWERGSGITQACGTGACASQVAAFHAGLTDREATVHMPGGDLTIRLDESTGHVLMTGEAETVFEGEIQPPTP